jgi:pimeloyl-ACP methyl ester carboxylesterase
VARAWVLVSCHARAEDAAGRAARAEAIGIVDRQGWQAWLEPLAPRWVASRQHDAQLEGMAGRAGDAGLTVALLALANRPDRRAILPVLSSPVVAVAGEMDPITPRIHLAEIADAVPRGSLRVVPGASHLVPLDAPQALAELLL